MPNRIIKESIKESAQIDSLSWFEEVLYYRLIVTADDYGCVDGRIALLRSKLFPLKDNVTKKAVEDAISHLVSAGLLCRYTVNGTPYLLFPTWEKHQRVRNQHRKYPEPPADILETVTCRTDGGQMTADCLSESNPIQSESNPNPNPKEKASAHKYGRYQNVLFTDEDLAKLKAEFPDWEDRIERLSEYIASTGKTYKSHLATIRNWARRDPKAPAKKNAPPSGTYSGRDDSEALLAALKGI